MSDVADTAQPTSITINETIYTKHDKHWYPDGNIIFTAQSVAFRLFQSFLIRRSDVIAAVLTTHAQHIPLEADTKPQDQRLLFGGVPVVPVDDKADDFALLLDAVLPQTCVATPISAQTPRLHLLRLAQIAQKYGVNDVVAQTVEVLEKVLPTTERPGGYAGGSIEAVRVIDWAHRCGFPQFLPMAFYYLAVKEWVQNKASLGMIPVLHPRDQIRIQRGRAQMQTEVIGVALKRWENSCFGTSKSEKSCPGKNRSCWMGYGGKAWDTSANPVRWTNLLLNPLDELSTRVNNRKLVPLRDLCKPCRDEFIGENHRMMEDLIGKLEKLFGLDEGKLSQSTSRT